MDPLDSQGRGTFDIQPQAANGWVPGDLGGKASRRWGAAGAQRVDGRLLWKFNSNSNYKGVEAVGGAWETPLVNSDGSVTFGTGNPVSIGCLVDRRSLATALQRQRGQSGGSYWYVRWYYQAVSNDFRDFDMQSSPISATVRGAPLVIGGGKMGFVYAVNVQTGTLLWKTPVGEHNSRGDDPLPTIDHQSDVKTPFTIPGSLGGVLTNMAIAGNSVY